MRRFSVFTAALVAAALLSGVDARLGADKPEAKVAPKKALKGAAGLAAAGPVKADAADATATVPGATTAAAPADAPAIATPADGAATATTPTTTTKKPVAAAAPAGKCMEKLEDGDVSVDVKVVEDNKWTDDQKNTFIHRQYRITNTGKKNLCKLELYIPTTMTIVEKFGGNVKEAKGGMSGDLFEWGKVVPTSAAEFGFIVKGDATSTMGDLCVTNFEACKEEEAPKADAAAAGAAATPKADAPKADATAADTPKAETPKAPKAADAPKEETPKAEAATAADTTTPKAADTPAAADTPKAETPKPKTADDTTEAETPKKATTTKKTSKTDTTTN